MAALYSSIFWDGLVRIAVVYTARTFSKRAHIEFGESSLYLQAEPSGEVKQLSNDGLFQSIYAPKNLIAIYSIQSDVRCQSIESQLIF